MYTCEILPQARQSGLFFFKPVKSNDSGGNKIQRSKTKRQKRPNVRRKRRGSLTRLIIRRKDKAD